MYEKRIYLDYDWLYRKYITEEISPYKICKEVPCSCSLIYMELRRLKTPIKNRSEAKQGSRNPMFGVKQSEEIIEKRILKLRGHICSEETRSKISEANAGENNGQWKGVPFVRVCETCGIEFRRNNGNVNQRFCSVRCARQGEHNPA